MAMQEGGRAVNNIVDALKSQPSTFAMIVISFGLLGYTFYEGASFNNQRTESLKLLISLQSEAQKLLSECQPAAPGAH